MIWIWINFCSSVWWIQVLFCFCCCFHFFPFLILIFFSSRPWDSPLASISGAEILLRVKILLFDYQEFLLSKFFGYHNNFIFYQVIVFCRILVHHAFLLYKIPFASMIFKSLTFDGSTIIYPICLLLYKTAFFHNCLIF